MSKRLAVLSEIISDLRECVDSMLTVIRYQRARAGLLGVHLIYNSLKEREIRRLLNDPGQPMATPSKLTIEKLNRMAKVMYPKAKRRKRVVKKKRAKK